MLTKIPSAQYYALIHRVAGINVVSPYHSVACLLNAIRARGVQHGQNCLCMLQGLQLKLESIFRDNAVTKYECGAESID